MYVMSADISAMRCAMNSSSDTSAVGFEDEEGSVGGLAASPSGLPGPEAEGVGGRGAFASAAEAATVAVVEFAEN